MPIEITVTQRTQIQATIKRLLGTEYAEEISPEEGRKLMGKISTFIASRFSSRDLVLAVIRKAARAEIKKYLVKREKEANPQR